MLLTAPDTARRRIVSVGMFDGVHEGHRALLRSLLDRARTTGLTPSVATFRNHPRRIVRPGERVTMLSALDERLRKLSECGVEDVVLLDFDERLRKLSAVEFISCLHSDYAVDAIVMGFNNRFGHDLPEHVSDYRTLAAPLGVEVYGAGEYRVAGTPAVSSSTVRRLLAACDVESAATILGHPYRLDGRVVHGKELGRTIGFPTANIVPADPASVIPGNGVYAVTVTLPDGTARPGMMNIGHRPTVDSPDSVPSLEVNIFDFDGDIYDKPVTVSFIAFLRHEIAFPSVEALRRRLEADRESVRKIIG